MKTLIFCLLVAAIAAANCAMAQGASAPAFEGEAMRTTTEGHTVLAWSLADDSETVRFELQRATDSSFSDARTIYLGIDHGSFVSGLRSGESWFRVRATTEDGRQGPWSEPVMVEVSYASTTEVVRMLLLGALVLIATIATIVAGHHRVERGQT